MIELTDLSAKLKLEFAGTTFSFRPLKYKERIKLTIATVKAFQMMFGDVKAVEATDTDGNKLMMNPYGQLVQNEIFGEQVDELIAMTLVESEQSFREQFAADFGKPFAMSLMLDMMSDRREREDLRDKFVSVQKLDFAALLKTLGNSDSTSDEQATKDMPDVEKTESSSETQTK